MKKSVLNRSEILIHLKAFSKFLYLADNIPDLSFTHIEPRLDNNKLMSLSLLEQRFLLLYNDI